MHIIYDCPRSTAITLVIQSQGHLASILYGNFLYTFDYKYSIYHDAFRD